MRMADRPDIPKELLDERIRLRKADWVLRRKGMKLDNEHAALRIEIGPLVRANQHDVVRSKIEQSREKWDRAVDAHVRIKSNQSYVQSLLAYTPALEMKEQADEDRALDAVNTTIDDLIMSFVKDDVRRVLCDVQDRLPRELRDMVYDNLLDHDTMETITDAIQSDFSASPSACATPLERVCACFTSPASGQRDGPCTYVPLFLYPDIANPQIQNEILQHCAKYNDEREVFYQSWEIDKLQREVFHSEVTVGDFHCNMLINLHVGYLYENPHSVNSEWRNRQWEKLKEYVRSLQGLTFSATFFGKSVKRRRVTLWFSHERLCACSRRLLKAWVKEIQPILDGFGVDGWEVWSEGKTRGLEPYMHRLMRDGEWWDG